MFDVDDVELEKRIKEFGDSDEKWKEYFNAMVLEDRTLQFSATLNDGTEFQLRGSIRFDTMEVTIAK